MKPIEENGIEPVYLYRNEIYRHYPCEDKHKELKIGDIIWDSRLDDFFLMESPENLKEISYVAPELWAILRKK